MKHFFIAAALFLAACATTVSPQQAVYQAESDYVVTLKLANQYASLPTCTTPATTVTTPSNPICKDSNALAALQKADHAAQAALGSAESTVRDPKFSGSVSDQAIVAAQNAVSAFTNIANALGVK